MHIPLSVGHRTLGHTQISQKTHMYLHTTLYTLFDGQLERFSRAILNVLSFCPTPQKGNWLYTAAQLTPGFYRDEGVWGVFVAFLTDYVP